MPRLIAFLHYGVSAAVRIWDQMSARHGGRPVSRVWRRRLPAAPADVPMVVPGLGDLVGDLLEAGDPEQMLQAAAGLRGTVLAVWRLMTHRHAARVLAVLLEEPGLSGPDPARLAARQADKAVDVVTALDYLIILLRTPADDEEALDLLTRRRLDARAAAVREGTWLLTMLPAGVVIVVSPPAAARTREGG